MLSLFGEEQLWFFALLMTVPRVLGAFLAMPFLGNTVLPGLARNAIVMIIAAFATPLTMDYIAGFPLNAGQIAFIMIKEALIGFMFGYLVSIPFWAVSISGFFIDLMRGSLSAQMFSNTLSDQSSPLGDLFTKLGVALLFTTGGFLMLVEVLLMSYKLWPVDAFIPVFNQEAANVLLGQFSHLFYIGVLIAGPVIATMYVVEIGAAIISRYVPQLNIFLLLMPIKSGIAILILVFYITYISRYLRASFLEFGDKFDMLDVLFR